MNERLNDYIEAHISPEPEWLKRVYRDTWLQRLYPRMCSGHVQGSLLTMITSMVSPRRVIELGTYTGYSALAMAAGLPDCGHIDTVEIDDEHEEFILNEFAGSPFASRITLHIGDALDTVPRITPGEGWDMAFIDANKRHYPEYYRMLRPLMAPGGYILADNTLWDAHVIDPAADADPQCRGIREFNDIVAADDGVFVTIVPVRDGLTIIKIK